MARKYLNRNLISKTGVSFSIKTAANEFSPHNQTPWLAPTLAPAAQASPQLSFALLLSDAAGYELLWGLCPCHQHGGMRLRLRGMRGVSPASPGAAWHRGRAADTPPKTIPAAQQEQAPAALDESSCARTLRVRRGGCWWRNWWEWLLQGESLLLSASLPLGLLDLSLWFSGASQLKFCMSFPSGLKHSSTFILILPTILRYLSRENNPGFIYSTSLFILATLLVRRQGEIWALQWGPQNVLCAFKVGAFYLKALKRKKNVNPGQSLFFSMLSMWCVFIVQNPGTSHKEVRANSFLALKATPGKSLFICLFCSPELP